MSFVNENNPQKPFMTEKIGLGGRDVGTYLIPRVPQSRAGQDGADRNEEYMTPHRQPHLDDRAIDDFNGRPRDRSETGQGTRFLGTGYGAHFRRSSSGREESAGSEKPRELI